MRYSFMAFVGLLGMSVLASASSAQCVGRKRCRQAASGVVAPAPGFQYANVQTTQYVTAPVGNQPGSTVTVSEATALSYSGDSPAAFLAQLNAYRAQHGRGPLQWDDNLANWAVVNSNAAPSRGPHGVQCGAGQCWASSRSYVGALSQWIASAPHRAILLNAQHSVGVGLGAGGATANAR